MILKLYLITFCLFVLTFYPGLSFPKLGRPKLRVIAIEVCPNENNSGNTFEPVLNNINSDGAKSLDVNLMLKKPVEANFRGVLTIEKLDNGEWQKGFFNGDGKVCDIINRYMSKAWAKLSREIQPNINESCHVEPGTYRLENFQVDQDGIIIGLLPGTLRAKMVIYNNENEIVLCGMVVAEFTAL